MKLRRGSSLSVAAVILGGGQGSRLYPLTRDRSKPAVPIAGKYRLVDIPISNCINSGMRHIYLLTQFNSVSLHDHVHATYRFGQFDSGQVRILAAQQTQDSESWYRGTADAVRQSFRYFMDEAPDLIVILSGDQLYRMDFQDVIEHHLDTGAEVTIATKPVPRRDAGSLGIMKVNEFNRITEFCEKPGDTDALTDLKAPMYSDERYLASMGIYVFNTGALRDLLEQVEECDFGKHIIPESIRKNEVFSYIYEGYWKDIGTLGSFWEANLGLTEVVPEFTFYDRDMPIYTHMRFLPPSKINCCDLNRCLLSEGCIISGHRILHSIVGVRAVVGERTVVEHSVLMGADYYEFEKPGDSQVPLGIGRDCYIHNAIVDKNARIGDGVYISPEGKRHGEETDQYTMRDGVIVIPKNAVIPSGTRL
jgi:glucose-1-phosphate adenylyltransferase